MWYFGNGAAISFNTSGKPVALTNSQMVTGEGSASIATKAGRLLFYTDGIKIWDSTHNTMPNGTGLNGNSSSTQSAVIVPRPDSSHRFYVFTVDELAGTKGFCYSEVDMKLNSGKGNVNSTKNILLTKTTCEKITAVKHANGKDYWVLTVKYYTDSVYAYLVTSTGVNSTPVKSRTRVTIAATDKTWTRGNMKASPDGTKIAYVSWALDSTVIADFNASTGAVTNVWTVHNPVGYGCEFSPKSKYLYVTELNNKKVFQYDAKASSKAAFRSSKRCIDSNFTGITASLQLGPDGKIYLSEYNTTYLHVIHAPDSFGFATRKQRNYVYLSGKGTYYGLPTFIQSIFVKRGFQYTRNCVKDSTFFTITDINYLDSVRWIFDDTASGSANTSKSTSNIFHVYKKSGYYNVSLISYFKFFKDTFRQKIFIKDPKPLLGKDSSFCNNFSFTIGPSKTYLTYKWNTGPTTKTIAVTQKGTYICTVKDSVGCLSADTVEIKNPQAKAQFYFPAMSGCLKGNRFTMKDTSKYKDDVWKKSTWYFGDGTNKTDTTAAKSYSDTGRYIVKLVLQSKANCKDSISKVIVVFPNSSPGFSINKSDQCLKGNSFNFTNTSTLSKGTFSSAWTFGDDSSSIKKDISAKNYLKDSTYTVRLITTTDNNCKDTTVKTVKVFPNTSVGFTPSKTNQCYNYNSTGFVNTSKIRTGSIASYSWNFGDNSTSSQKDITGKVYSSADSFKVSLRTISDKGCRDSLTKTIYIWPNSVPGFTVNKVNQCLKGNSFNFTNTTTLAKGTNTYFWQFGDDSTSSQKDISGKIYLKDSSYSVRLVSTSDKNCKDTFNKQIVVFPNTSVSFVPSKISQCYNGNTTDFTNTSTIRTGTIATYAWSFGDNTSSSQKSITGKKYTTADSFKVMLLAISDKGCRDSLSKSVYIWENSSPGFSINKPLQCFNGHGFNFINTSTIAKGSISYEWLFGDNSTGISKDVTGKTYMKDSSYTIRLITTSDRNCMDTINKNITVYPNTKIGFTPSKITQCFNYHRLDFVNGSTVRTGSIATYRWNLGDITTASTRDVMNKRYNIADSFKVSLLTITDKGCRDSIEKSIYIWPNTVIGFGISKDTQCFEWNRFDFTNTSTLQAGIMSYDWQLGDATSDTSRNISGKKYALFGAYQVKLHTTTDRNCKDTMTKQVIVHASPVAKFMIDKDRQCFRANVFNFTNQTTINNGSVSTYDWNMDNGQKRGTQHVPNYTYTTEDSFDVRLIALSDKGCYDTVSHMAVTFAQPVAKYQIPNDSQCWQKHYFIIINQTALKYGSMTHNWDFGDKTADNSYTPATKSYANKSAKYTIRYKVTSDHGCTDSLNHNINLLERPISEFDINDSVQCFRGHLFSFTNKTTFSAMNTMSYFWDYGNGNTSTGITPNTAVYPSAQYYPVQLTSYSYLTNCYDTVIYNVLPAPHSVPGFTIDKDSQCLRFNQYNFTNKSTLSFGTMSYKWDYKDGTKSTQKDPAKHYLSGNNYLVKLVVTTNHNCSDSIEKPIVLIPHPKAKFTINDTSQCLNGHAFDLTNSTTLAYGTYTSMWLFDDATSNTAKDVNAKTFASPYQHKVILTVNSGHGCTDTTQRWVHLEKPNSTQVQLTENDSQCLKGNRFTVSSTSSDPAVIHSSHKWEFGDGNTSTTNPANHQYIKDGTLKILLETISANGCKDSAYLDVVVHPQPVSSFTASAPCFPDPVFFTNTSTISSGNIVSSEWDLGEGTKTKNVNPSKQYGAPGNYKIVLVSESNYGCRDTLTNPSGVLVRKKPKAKFDFTTLPSKEFDLTSLQMNNQSTDDPYSSYWDFGNGTGSTDKNPIAEYRDTSSRTITLIVTNAENCQDTFVLPTGKMITDFFFYLPTAFSPDDNGKNEEYKPVANPYIWVYIMEIYNRWGEKVFETRDITKGWDGTYMGEKCEQGIYLCKVYVVPLRGKLESHEVTVTLLR